MNIKKILAGAATSVLMLGVFAASTFAAPQGQNLNASLCNANGAPVVNITYKVINDPDSGVATNPWATDNYNKRVQV